METRASHNPSVAILIAVWMLALLFGGVACTRADMRYESRGASYTLDSAAQLVEGVDTPEFAGRPTREAESLRHDQLVALRSEGEGAVRLVELLTATFPDESRSVPFYAEEATVDGRPAWIVLEMWGPMDGELDNVRLWVFDRDTGEVMLATSARPSS